MATGHPTYLGQTVSDKRATPPLLEAVENLAAVHNRFENLVTRLAERLAPILNIGNPEVATDEPKGPPTSSLVGELQTLRRGFRDQCGRLEQILDTLEV